MNTAEQKYECQIAILETTSPWANKLIVNIIISVRQQYLQPFNCVQYLIVCKQISSNFLKKKNYLQTIHLQIIFT